MIAASCAARRLAAERGWSAPTVAGGVMYIGTRDGRLLALKASKAIEERPLDKDNLILGKDEWEFAPQEERSFDAVYSTPVVHGDRVFVGMNRNRKGVRNGEKSILVAVSRADGKLDSLFEVKGRIYAGPVLYKGQVVFADDEGWVYAVDSKDERAYKEWKVSDKRFWSAPAVVDGVIYIGGMDKRLYALDIETGKPVWDEPFKAGGAIASRPLVVGDTIYVGDFNRTFHAIDRATGQERAAFQGDGWFWNDAVYKNGVVYVGSLGGTFYALDAETLEQKWRFPRAGSEETKTPIRSAPMIVGDRIFIATRGGSVHALDLKDGRPDRRARLTVGAKILASLVYADGALYVRDQKQRLHILEASAE